MIYWFTATGNSKHAAMRLGELLQEETIEITHNTEIDKSSKQIFVIPLYFWTLPVIVHNLFEKSLWRSDQDVFVVFTCGGYIGTADRDVKKLVYPANSYVYQLPMVTNYIIWHEVGSDEMVREKLKKADVALETIALQIKSATATYRSPFYLIFIGKIIKLTYDLQRKTKKFYATNKCISCKLCETNCPDQAIRLMDGKPQWIKDKCEHCLRCIHCCPGEAIEYGKETVGKKRYRYTDQKLHS